MSSGCKRCADLALSKKINELKAVSGLDSLVWKLIVFEDLTKPVKFEFSLVSQFHELWFHIKNHATIPDAMPSHWIQQSTTSTEPSFDDAPDLLEGLKVTLHDGIG